jgi:hypothetical protein
MAGDEMLVVMTETSVGRDKMDGEEDGKGKAQVAERRQAPTIEL